MTNNNKVAHKDDKWRVSSFSNSGGSCVQVKLTTKEALVRDSKNLATTAPVISFSPRGWTSLLNNISSPA